MVTIESVLTHCV